MIRLSSLIRYEVREVDAGYEFETDSGDLNLLSFIEYPVLCCDGLPCSVFMFNIERIVRGKLKNQHGNKLKNTIVYVLSEFFGNHANSLVTVCDITDGKQIARNRLFNRWYEEFGRDFLVKIESSFQIEGTTTFASLFFPKNHPLKNLLETEFQKLSEMNFYC